MEEKCSPPLPIAYRESNLTLTRHQRIIVIVASLGALFLGAMDALIISAAMPTIVADLGGLDLYSWVYSAYFLSRAVSLPIFGKLADLYKSRTLFMVTVGIFLISSLAAGFAWNMTVLIIARIVQGIGAGGLFALVYIVLSDISAPEARARTLSLASFTWGVASVLGPTLGGIIVTYFSWRWMFWINLPLGLACLWGIGAHLVEIRPKKETVSLDLWGVSTLTTTILAFLMLLMTAGRTYAWTSPPMIALMALSFGGLIAFIRIELRAKDPILSIHFFGNRSFSAGNGALFLSSFTLFSLFAFAPLYIQGAQGRTPMQVGMALLSLTLGWSLSSVVLGQFIDRVGRKPCAVAGAVALIAGCAMTLNFTTESTMTYCAVSFLIVGVGMGFVALATLLMVQAGVGAQDLGVATSANQFARTLGGAVGVGVCGGLVAARFSHLTDAITASGVLDHLPASVAENRFAEIGQLFDPEVQMTIPPELMRLVQGTVARGVGDVFITATVSATLCLLVCLMLPSEPKSG